jgi:hypothetical protein
MKVTSVVAILIVMISVTPAMAKENCGFTDLKNGAFELSFQKKKVNVAVVERDAKLLSCSQSQDFPHLLIAEIDLGSGGTKNQINGQEVFFISTTGKDLEIIYNHRFKEITREIDVETKAVQTDQRESPYQVLKSAQGNPVVELLKTHEKITLQIN